MTTTQEIIKEETQNLLIQDIENGFFDVASYCDNPEEILG